MTDPASIEPPDDERPVIDAARAADLTGERSAVAGPPSRLAFRRARERRHLRRRRRLAGLMIVLGVALIAAAVWRWWTLATDDGAAPWPAPPPAVITVL